MKTALILLPLAAIPALYAQDTPVAMTHQDYASALIDLLSETELSLAQCTDAQSRDAQLPKLRELSERMKQLHQIERNLPEPTIADYIAAEQQVGNFNMLWNTIKKHVERLNESKLYNKDMLEIIKLVN